MKKSGKIIIAVVGACAAVEVVAALFLLNNGIKPSSLEIKAESYELTDGGTEQLECKLSPFIAKSDISWTSSNESIATIDQEGNVQALTAGTVTITAEADNGVSATCNIVISSDQPTVYYGIDYKDVYDYNYYIQNNSDVRNACGEDPETVLAYFVETGLPSGQQGIADFNVIRYAFQNADLRDKYGSDLSAYAIDYIETGKAEGRPGFGTTDQMTYYETVYNGVDYSAVYDYNYYIQANPTVFQLYNVDDATVLEYFVRTGMPNGEQGSAEFNPFSYAYLNKEVRDRCHQSMDHYIEQGIFDYTTYYMDYLQTGKAEGLQATDCDSMKDYATVYNGIDYSAEYDFNVYVQKNPSVMGMFGCDDEATLEHYVKNGRDAGWIAK